MGSAIDPRKPLDGVPASKADLRGNLEAARAELNHGGFYKSRSAEAVERRVAERLDEIVSVGDFGAVGDGLSDDAEVLRHAAAAAQGRGKPLFFPSTPSGYAIASTLVLPAGIDILMDGYLLYTGDADEPCLVIGASGPDHDNFRRILRVDVVRQQQSDWLDENNIGVQFLNATDCSIFIRRAEGFTIGVQCKGDGSDGFAYNDVRLGGLLNNKIGLDLTSERDGWCNENVFINGRFSCFRGVNPNRPRYGTRITAVGGYRNQNNNLFLKPSYELKTESTSGEAIPILIPYGDDNRFLHIRNEDNDRTVARIENSGTGNIIEVGHTSLWPVLEDHGTEQTSLLLVARQAVTNFQGQQSYFSGKLLDDACEYDGEGRIYVGGCFFSSTTQLEPTIAGSAGVSLGADHIEIGIPDALSIRVDTTNHRRLIVRREVVAGFEGRLLVRAYDQDGVVLGGSAPQYIAFQGSWFSSWGGWYATGTDHASALAVNVHRRVAYVDLMFTSGTRRCRLKSFTITSPSQSALLISTPFKRSRRATLMATAPPATAGRYERGQRIWNDRPDASGPLGWVCTKGGSPGEWRAIAGL